MNSSEQSKGEIVIYLAEDGKVAIDVVLSDETVWVTQEQMSLLFGKATSTINEHIKNIFAEGALEKAEQEYTIYRQRELNQLESDYDRAVRQLSLFSGANDQLTGEK